MPERGIPRAGTSAPEPAVGAPVSQPSLRQRAGAGGQSADEGEPWQDRRSGMGTQGVVMRRFGFLALFWAVIGLAPVPVMAFDLQAHRGCRGLLPENTLAGFEHALRLGVTTLELDIAITADGVPVISHDPAPVSYTHLDVYKRQCGGRWPWTGVVFRWAGRPDRGLRWPRCGHG